MALSNAMAAMLRHVNSRSAGRRCLPMSCFTVPPPSPEKAKVCATVFSPSTCTLNLTTNRCCPGWSGDGSRASLASTISTLTRCAPLSLAARSHFSWSSIRVVGALAGASRVISARRATALASSSFDQRLQIDREFGVDGAFGLRLAELPPVACGVGLLCGAARGGARGRRCEGYHHQRECKQQAQARHESSFASHGG